MAHTSMNRLGRWTDPAENAAEATLAGGGMAVYPVESVTALIRHTRRVGYMDDGEVAVLTKDGIQCYNHLMQPVEKEISYVDWEIDAAEKGGYEHFMFKEIMEQPEAFRKTISPRIRDGKIVLDDITLTKEQIQDLRKVFIVVPLTLLLPHLFGLGTTGVFLAEPISNFIGGAACFFTMLKVVGHLLREQEQSLASAAPAQK